MGPARLCPQPANVPGTSTGSHPEVTYRRAAVCGRPGRGRALPGVPLTVAFAAAHSMRTGSLASTAGTPTADGRYAPGSLTSPISVRTRG